MAFRSTSNDYNIITEGELGAILSNFDPDMIFNVLENNMNNKYREYESELTNIVTSFEYSFKALSEEYGDNIEIKNTRNETYALIVQRICSFHNLEINTEENVDMYALASIMYEFFVSSFTKYIGQFFVTYILRERESIYNMILTLDDDKKVKNNSVLYAKKIYESDQELAAIYAYVPFIVNSICEFNIPLHDYISCVYKYEPEKANFLNSVIQNNEDFFPNFIVPYTKTYFVRIVTSIRLALQGEDNLYNSNF